MVDYDGDVHGQGGLQYKEVRPGLVQGVIGNALSGGGADYRHAAHVLPNRVKHTGPLAFAISVYDGFQSTLTRWISRYISIYLWLPVSDLFSSVLARIQTLMLQKDIEQLSDPDFIPDGSSTVYIIFMIIGIVATSPFQRWQAG